MCTRRTVLFGLKVLHWFRQVQHGTSAAFAIAETTFHSLSSATMHRACATSAQPHLSLQEGVRYIIVLHACCTGEEVNDMVHRVRDVIDESFQRCTP